MKIQITVNKNTLRLRKHANNNYKFINNDTRRIQNHTSYNKIEEY